MAIIYSYPIEATPTTSDLLLGTSVADDNKPTKSFTIASLAALVSANAGTGTVTNVATANSTFINMTGGAISTSGTLQASLSASGTPSSSTFLRGDNTWSPATSTGSPNIAVLDEGSPITTAVESLNFTGGGVIMSNSGNDVVIDIPAPTSAVSSLIAGTGISVDQATGDVTVTNTGVTSLIAGTNITLSPTSGVGNVTINATNNPGTVQSVIPGSGLQLDSGSLTSDPSIGVEYDGSNNYILVGKASGATPATVATSDDFIAFNQLSSSNVKTTTLATVPASALTLVEQYINDGDANSIKNTDDNYTTTPKVTKIVTLTVSQYATAPKDTNTLYIVVDDVDACTETTTNFTIDTAGPPGITGGTAGVDYTLETKVNGVVAASFVSCEGESYEVITTATPAAGKYFSTPVTGNITSGTSGAPGGSPYAVTQSLTGVIADNPTPEIKATLLVVTNIQGPGGDGSGFTITGDDTGATNTTSSATSLAYSFTTACAAKAGYTFSSGPTYSPTQPTTGTINGSQTVVTTITGTLELT